MKKVILKYWFQLWLGFVVLTCSVGACFDDQPVTMAPDAVDNPNNWEYVIEVAFNLDIPVDSVTQEQFNERYINQ